MVYGSKMCRLNLSAFTFPFLVVFFMSLDIFILLWKTYRVVNKKQDDDAFVIFHSSQKDIYLFVICFKRCT